MTLTEGMKVYTEEHVGSVGFVKEVTETGAKIEFVTPARPSLPYGHIGLEFWPVADWHLLTAVDSTTPTHGAVCSEEDIAEDIALLTPEELAIWRALPNPADKEE